MIQHYKISGLCYGYQTLIQGVYLHFRIVYNRYINTVSSYFGIFSQVRSKSVSFCIIDDYGDRDIPLFKAQLAGY